MYAFIEKPVFGHGVGNIGTVHNKYIKEGRLNKVVYQKQAEELGTAAHVHSAYFGYLADTGIVGFVIILLMMLYPTYLALKWRGQSRNAWKFLLLHNVAFLVASLTEIPFIRNNWSSMFLLFNVVFFIWLIDDIKKAQNARPQRN
jgi:O-antigen ligase